VSALDEVAGALGCGRTVSEVRDALRVGGRASITRADVLRVLTTNPHRFRADGNDPARWWPADHVAVAAVVCADPGLDGGDAGDGRTDSVELYAWQRDALDAWRRRRGRGVVEAVTGTGKTMVGVAAATEELGRGGQVLVLVPTRELLAQWCLVLAQHGPSRAHVGRLGGGHHDDLGRHDIVVAIVNSARDADLRPRRPGGLLIADECHRYGSDGNRVALHAGFARRLGLSATYARSDEAHLTWLDPYFGGTCMRMGYARAIADGVVARFTVDLLGVELTPGEQAEYQHLTLEMSAARARLIAAGAVPADPIGAFFTAVARLARSGDDGPVAMAARCYLRAMQGRRRLLAETPAKAAALDALVPSVRRCDRAIVFTQSIRAAERATDRLRRHAVPAAAIHSQLDWAQRRSTLSRFAAGDLRALAAPQVLDEGVDVPAADLAIILAASRSRRQMIQRMGRVLRRKPDGRSARFVVVYAANTVEDPALGAHEGFLDEITLVADGVRTLRLGDLLDRLERTQGAIAE